MTLCHQEHCILYTQFVLFRCICLHFFESISKLYWISHMGWRCGRSSHCAAHQESMSVESSKCHVRRCCVIIVKYIGRVIKRGMDLFWVLHWKFKGLPCRFVSAQQTLLTCSLSMFLNLFHVAALGTLSVILTARFVGRTECLSFTEWPEMDRAQSLGSRHTRPVTTVVRLTLVSSWGDGATPRLSVLERVGLFVCY